MRLVGGRAVGPPARVRPRPRIASSDFGGRDVQRPECWEEPFESPRRMPLAGRNTDFPIASVDARLCGGDGSHWDQPHDHTAMTRCFQRKCGK